jgi:BRCT domain type II-containing protein
MNQKQTMPLSKPGQAKAKEEQTTSGAAEKTQSSAGSARYSKAMGEFSKKYPQEAKEITSKVMQSLMGFGSANKK